MAVAEYALAPHRGKRFRSGFQSALEKLAAAKKHRQSEIEKLTSGVETADGSQGGTVAGDVHEHPFWLEEPPPYQIDPNEATYDAVTEFLTSSLREDPIMSSNDLQVRDQAVRQHVRLAGYVRNLNLHVPARSPRRSAGNP